MNSNMRAAYVTRDKVLKLLSDDELASAGSDRRRLARRRRTPLVRPRHPPSDERRVAVCSDQPRRSSEAPRSDRRSAAVRSVLRS